MAQIHNRLGVSIKEKVRLRRAGFTVTDTAIPGGSDTITGGTDGLLAKLIHGRSRLQRLKKMGIRA